jgi:hypothetical protein
MTDLRGACARPGKHERFVVAMVKLAEWRAGEAFTRVVWRLPH